MHVKISSGTTVGAPSLPSAHALLSLFRILCIMLTLLNGTNLWEQLDESI